MGYTFMDFLEEEFMITPYRICKWIIGIMLFFFILGSASAFYNNGIERTHNGHIIYVSHNYNRLNNYEWTDVEVLTYSGDTHHIYFWEHVSFQLNTNYHIHTKQEYRLMYFITPHWEMNEVITELEIIQ